MSNYEDYEKCVANYFKEKGFTIIWPENKNQFAWDFEIERNGKFSVVQVKDFIKPVGKNALINLIGYIMSPRGNRYEKAYLVARSGFTKSVHLELAKYEPNEQERIKLIDLSDSVSGTFTIAVCTGKGGVGKTTVAAHLAGAFTMGGFTVALVDADPMKHLCNILQLDLRDTSHIEFLAGDPEKRESKKDYQFSLFSLDDFWNPNYKNEKGHQVVIYDCPPDLNNSNLPEILKKADMCLLPITLSPISLGKNFETIKWTFDNSRKYNSNIDCFVIINNFIPLRNANSFVKKSIKDIATYCSKKQNRYNLAGEKIRHSDMLYYWGANDDKENMLAFGSHGGKSNPKEDFLKLASYLCNFLELKANQTKNKKSNSEVNQDYKNISQIGLKDIADKLNSKKGLASISIK